MKTNYELKIPKRIEKLMSTDPVFCEVYEKAEETFSRAKKTETLLDVMLPCMAKKQGVMYQDKANLAIQIRSAIDDLKQSYSSLRAKRLAVLIAAFDRMHDIQSSAFKQEINEIKKISGFAQAMSAPKKVVQSNLDNEDLVASLKASIDAYASSKVIH